MKKFVYKILKLLKEIEFYFLFQYYNKYILIIEYQAFYEDIGAIQFKSSIRMYITKRSLMKKRFVLI